MSDRRAGTETANAKERSRHVLTTEPAAADEDDAIALSIFLSFSLHRAAQGDTGTLPWLPGVSPSFIATRNSALDKPMDKYYHDIFTIKSGMNVQPHGGQGNRIHARNDST